MVANSSNIFSSKDLNTIERLIWDYFQQGVRNKKSAFHYPTIGTFSKSSFSLRTVILRNVIRKERTISFYTDDRSKKIKELKDNKNIFIHIYDKKNQVQVQSEGKAQIFNKSKLNKEIWNSFSSYAKSIYLSKKAPGKKIINENADLKLLDIKKGFENFSIVKAKINKITFLKLNEKVNHKAFFKYKSKNKSFFWVVP